MTKDAAYLRGLRDLVLHLHAGETLEFLFVGKLALSQVPVLRDLEQDGLLVPPRLLPLHMDTPAGQDRLDSCRRHSLPELIAGSAAA